MKYKFWNFDPAILHPRFDPGILHPRILNQRASKRNYVLHKYGIINNDPIIVVTKNRYLVYGTKIPVGQSPW